MLIDKVCNTIKKSILFEKGDRVIIGLSGGPDSVCLFHVLHSISRKYDLELYAVHVNHLLRGSESEQDELYVRNLCKNFGIRLFVKRLSIEELAAERGLSLEEAGREARYEQFRLVAKEIGATKIAVGHNKNDQAETLLMRIIRGTGLEGLKGMEYKRGSIIRPLLDIERREIEVYCESNKLNPRTDSSNLENIYTRNKIRLDLIPQINKMFETDITETLFRMSKLLREDNEYIEQNAVIIYNQCIAGRKDREIHLDIPKIQECHKAIAKKIIRMAIKDVKGDTKGIESNHVDKVLELVYKAKTGLQYHLPSQVRIRITYGLLEISCGKNEAAFPEYEETIRIPGVTTVEQMNLQVQAEVLDIGKIESIAVNEKALEQVFDFDMLSKGINIRNRRNGDVFRPYKSNGTKKLKEYFIDSKIPRDLRDKIPLIAKDKEIVWIIGSKISDKFTVTENTKSVLKLSCLNCKELLQ